MSVEGGRPERREPGAAARVKPVDGGEVGVGGGCVRVGGSIESYVLTFGCLI